MTLWRSSCCYFQCGAFPNALLHHTISGHLWRRSSQCTIISTYNNHHYVFFFLPRLWDLSKKEVCLHSCLYFWCQENSTGLITTEVSVCAERAIIQELPGDHKDRLANHSQQAFLHLKIPIQNKYLHGIFDFVFWCAKPMFTTWFFKKICWFLI